MNGTWVGGLIIGIVIATAGGAIAGYRMLDEPAPPPPAFAEVLAVVPATADVSKEREVCEDVEVTHQEEPRDKHRVLGTVSGAVIGGVLGNQVGGGSGKKLATVAGAVAGGYAGNKLQQRAQSNDTYTTTEQQCETVVDVTQTVIGYDVTYRIGSEEGRIRMDHDPGEQIPLVDGALAPEVGQPLT
jgi:uncharacterized protein YcfJ